MGGSTSQKDAHEPEAQSDPVPCDEEGQRKAAVAKSTTAKGDLTCYCGAVKIEVEGDPAVAVACHCDDCRRWSGGPYQAAKLYPADKVKISGELLTKGVSGSSHRHSCKKCGGLVCDDKKHTPMNMMMIPAGLWKSEEFTPAMHIMYKFHIKPCKDGIPKYADLPKDMGGSDAKMEDDFEMDRAKNDGPLTCYCGAVKI